MATITINPADVAKYAQLQFHPAEILILLQIPIFDICELLKMSLPDICVLFKLPPSTNLDDEFQVSYARGRLQAQAVVRGKLLNSITQDGDRAAIKQFLELCDKPESSNNGLDPSLLR